MKTVKNDSDVKVNACAWSLYQFHVYNSHETLTEFTKVFQLMGSTKPFTTSAIISAPTFARPTIVGSRLMHVSHDAHWCAIAGMGLTAHKLFLNCVAHMAISCTISVYTE